jgi:DNA-directed RNA polymerase specialized sigma24 family protein
VVTLFYLEQLKLSEISMILGDSESSLKMRLSRARKKLKTDISKKYEGEIEDIIYG